MISCDDFIVFRILQGRTDSCKELTESISNWFYLFYDIMWWFYCISYSALTCHRICLF